MKFPSFQLMLFAILCTAIATGRSIDCGSNAFLNSKSIACRGGYGGTYMPMPTGGGGNSGTGTNGGGNTAGGAANDATEMMSAMSAMGEMPATVMRTAAQTMGTMMDMMSNMNPLG